ncbi:conserved protein of unknown function [Methylocaldum szegediense]|jgi:hypothetical protein|uniref:Uncharacterized protein n=1 Tax=Methylocaldum szegediense TaxID=73780 RepID=A0ABN8X8M0_9GAMM|nr:conserved protein of unknown function [Methylocaldum szegediense]
MQVIAPWVHAHTGTETGGFLHVPGLEFLSKATETSAQADAPPLDHDVIIGVQAGFWGETAKAKFSPKADDKSFLPSFAGLIRRPPIITYRRIWLDVPLPLSWLYRASAPRAPPFDT